MTDYTHDSAMSDLDEWQTRAQGLPKGARKRLAAYIEELEASCDTSVLRKTVESQDAIIERLEAERDEWEQVARVLARQYSLRCRSAGCSTLSARGTCDGCNARSAETAIESARWASSRDESRVDTEVGA